MSDRPWARVTRIGGLWLKECRPVQAYEVPLTIALASRWGDRVPELLAADEARAWLLLRDAGKPGSALDALPLYAELQQGETAHVDEHLAAGVPDQRLDVLREAFPRRFPEHASLFEEWCSQLTLPPTVQHDDLHSSNVYEGPRIIDWGDTVIAHPFASMLNALRANPDDAATLRDAYLDAWPGEHRAEFDAAFAVAAFARILSWERIGPAEPLARNVEWFLENIVSS